MVNKLDWTIFVLDKISSYNLIKLSRIKNIYNAWFLLIICYYIVSNVLLHHQFGHNLSMDGPCCDNRGLFFNFKPEKSDKMPDKITICSVNIIHRNASKF